MNLTVFIKMAALQWWQTLKGLLPFMVFWGGCQAVTNKEVDDNFLVIIFFKSHY